jgi:hypothetical protein
VGIISFYGAAARPPVTQSKPPMLVADLISECVRTTTGGGNPVPSLKPVFHERRGAALDRGRYPQARRD